MTLSTMGLVVMLEHYHVQISIAEKDTQLVFSKSVFKALKDPHYIHYLIITTTILHKKNGHTNYMTWF